MYSCERIQETLTDYINRRLSQSECSHIAVHLSECKKCRDEAAFLIRISKSLNGKTTDIPIEILKSAFKKIHNGKPKNEARSELLS